MSNPATQAFFLGRALAEVLGEKVESSFTHLISEFGKFDAEQRDHLRHFAEEVRARAEQNAQSDTNGHATVTVSSQPASVDLQENIDELRAEIARLKAELHQYRTQQSN